MPLEEIKGTAPACGAIAPGAGGDHPALTLRPRLAAPTSKTPQSTTSIWTRGYEDFGHGAVLALYPEDGVVIAVTSKSGERYGAPWSHQLVKDLEAIALSRETKPR